MSRAPGPDDPGPDGDGRALGRWYAVATTLVAPATLLSALLFYFGYVSSRAQLSYFGVDIDTVGMGTQDVVLRSPQALLVPVLLLAVLGAGLVLAQQRLASERLGDDAVRRIGVAGGATVTVGAVLLLAFGWIGDWPAYPMVTPLVLALGFLLLAWSWHRLGARRTATGLILLAAVTCAFWATATLAEWTGRGVAQRTADDLGTLPAVVLDTEERLYLTDGVTSETRLPSEKGQDYRYRYRGLRLLVHGDDRMFLVPETWTSAGSTVVVPLDDARVRFRFVNDPP